jgi:hypothetical protein
MKSGDPILASERVEKHVFLLAVSVTESKASSLPGAVNLLEQICWREVPVSCLHS